VQRVNRLRSALDALRMSVLAVLAVGTPAAARREK
jgi:hypothetical protein